MNDLMRRLRPVADLVVPFAFTGPGFELNRRGFADERAVNLSGRVALVTGANAGIGLATAEGLARRGLQVWLLCRDEARGTAALEALRSAVPDADLALAVVDVSSIDSVRRFVEAFPPSRVDVLVHNAGVLPHTKSLSPEGIETTFATSVVGPFALTALLLDRLARSDDARVVFVSSGGMLLQRLDLGIPDEPSNRYDGLRAYANAKRAQVVLVGLFAEKMVGTAPITFASMHPGWVDTAGVRTALPTFHARMGRALRTPAQGADTIVWLATSETPKSTLGEFWFDRRVAPRHLLPWTRESERARGALWERCVAASGVDPSPKGPDSDQGITVKPFHGARPRGPDQGGPGGGRNPA